MSCDNCSEIANSYYGIGEFTRYCKKCYVEHYTNEVEDEVARKLTLLKKIKDHYEGKKVIEEQDAYYFNSDFYDEFHLDSGVCDCKLQEVEDDCDCEPDILKIYEMDERSIRKEIYEYMTPFHWELLFKNKDIEEILNVK